MVTYLVVFLMADIGIHAWTNLCGCNRLQRNDSSEQITFDKLRLSARIKFGIFVGVTHTGAEFVGKGYFTENLCNRWIFGKRLKLRKIQNAVTICKVTVFGIHSVFFDNKLRHIFGE